MKVKGRIIRYIYRDEQNGFSIIAFNSLEKGLLKIKGIVSPYIDSTPMELELKAPEAGKDLYEILNLEEYINEPLLLAEFMENLKVQVQVRNEILKKVAAGNTFISVVEATEEAALPRKKEILNVRYQRLFREYLQKYTDIFSYFDANLFVSNFGKFAMSEFQRNPYMVSIRYLGIPMKEAEKIAKAMGNEPTDKDRVNAISFAQLQKAEREGHTCISVRDACPAIQEEVYSLAGIPLSIKYTESAIKANSSILTRKGYICLGNTYTGEELIARRIREIQKKARALFRKEELETAIQEIQEKEQIQYAPAQKAAFRLLEKSGVSVLTGGPGTGKTTVIKGLISAYLSKYPLADIVMTSPTGRAAQRMSETTGQEAMTVHRLVGIGRMTRGKEKISGSLIIVDESSMLDAEMAAWLLVAIQDDALVLFVGDIDQLPSVGPGNFLKDLINSGTVPVCRLQTVFRQSGESPIITNATRINQGSANLVENESFQIFRECSDKSMLERMKIIVQQEIGKTKDLFDLQILDTSHKGEAGIAEANRVLQEMINPAEKGKKSLRFGKSEFREGDKIITTSNNYEAGYFNGDIGKVIHIEDGRISVNINGKVIDIPRQNLRDVSLGYCISIHKSQGSEFKHAVILLPEKPAIMLKRNLLYTGVTRGKQKVSLISSKKSIEMCVANIDNTKRVTMLPTLLAGGLAIGTGKNYFGQQVG